MKVNCRISVLWAVLAATLYAAGSPFSKFLLQYIPPAAMAAFLYLGAGIGMGIVGIVKSRYRTNSMAQNLTREEMPYIIGMVLLDIAAPIFFMIGLNRTTAANASLLNNFEIAATTFIALLIFKETISRKLWVSVGLITVASMILSFEDLSSLSFSTGSLFVLLACTCWGFENNCTKMLSNKSPLQIVIIKGLGSGLGSLIIAFFLGEKVTGIIYIIGALTLGFISYGLSIFFYVYAQRGLGAAKTSAYYAIAPFLGVVLSFILFKEPFTLSFLISLLIMIVGTCFATYDTN
jgi:drug/metabolite transporter (DMT)-like permease